MNEDMERKGCLQSRSSLFSLVRRKKDPRKDRISRAFRHRYEECLMFFASLDKIHGLRSGILTGNPGACYIFHSGRYGAIDLSGNKKDNEVNSEVS